MIPVQTDLAPIPSGPYSQAVRSNDLVFSSGQIPMDPKTMLIPDDVSEQIRTVLRNLVEVMSAGGAKEILFVTIYLTDMNDFQTMNSVYSEFFASPYPARTCVGVATLPKGVRIMADAVGRV